MNFITLTIALPENKYISWKEDILEILEAVNTSFKEPEKMIGRLVHLGIVLPSIQYFIKRLRELLRKAANRRRINLNTDVNEDLKLMLFSWRKHTLGRY